ncbi:hypothetical protein [Polyangium aurulentum]|uniref:hypothetical protein n=1 Tax=Polyangium aurulentum TaxID=2567896 RepID=UPI001139F7E3|nr:hypothetical protein [Polyangium aurulentum]UQA58898.1 hypothetical protein E8A73_048070 [Polyangium aurulentum]
MRRAQSSLRALGCEEAPVREAAIALERMIDARVGSGGGGPRRAFLLLAAAIHAASPFPQPHEPLSDERPDAPLSPGEWLLLAARERLRASFPPDVGEAFDRAIAAVDASLEAPARAAIPATSPLLDYALSEIVPAALGRAGDPAIARAGRSLGHLVRLAHEARALLGAGVYAPLPLLIGQIAADAGQPERIRIALAHAGKPVADRLPLLSVFGDGAVATRIAAFCSAQVDEAANVTDEQARATLAPLLAPLGARVARGAKGARLFGLAPRPPSPSAELDRAIQLAREALVADVELRECWEIQRSGGVFDTPRVARLFPVGLCLLALHGAGQDIASRAAPLLARRGPDGFRYYEDYSAIPPDSDDLGLVLQLSARLPQDRALREALAWPVELLVRGTGEDGTVPVWLERDLREPMPGDAPRWLGPRCVAVAANALIGLAEAAVPLPEGYFDRTLAWIAQTWEAEGLAATWHYGPAYTRLLLARLLRAAEGVQGQEAPRARLRESVAAIEAAIVASQEADGGWGSPLATACHLAVLSLGGRTPFDPWPAITYLASRQMPDGLWPREPLYRCPGKDGAPLTHGARPLTAAVCLSALVEARARLVRDRS